MTRRTAPLNTTALDGTQLWEQLSQSLSQLLDAHGVCATAVAEIATALNCTTVMAMYSMERRLYDVWIAYPDGELTQTRWEEVDDTFVAIANEAKTIYLEKFVQPAAEQIRSELWHLAREGALIAPLPLPGNDFTPKGAICIIDPSSALALTPRELDFLAMQLSVYLDRAYLRHKSVQQEIEFAIVSDISYALTATLNVESVYEQLRDPVRRTLNVESISIGLYDPISEEIVFINRLMGPLFRDLPPVRLKRGQGIAGYVAQHAEPIIVNRAYEDRRFFSRIDNISGFETKSIMCVPLMVEGRIIGVLEAINKRSGNFTNQDLRLLQAISAPLAVAIENTRLHNDVVSEKRRIETMFASLTEGVLTIDRNGVVTAANDALASLLQVENSGMLAGKSAPDIIKFTSGGFDEFMEEVFQQQDGQPQLATGLYTTQGESIPIYVSGTTIVDDDDNIEEAIFVFNDLRYIHEIERMRDDFFNNVIHELRTPLATILMYARMLRDGKATGDRDKTDRFLGVIERESDRLQSMVRQMLRAVKMEARESQRSSEPVDINQLLDEILPPLADRASEKGLVFHQRVEAALPSVLGDSESLYILFKNLVENAIKFTTSGAVRVRAFVEDGSINFHVADEGIGIPEQGMPNLFKRFYRTATAVERGIAGTGLGLYMVKVAVDKNGGSIEVDSQEGQGTTFRVQLPAYNQP
jgi:signal transduction histidine kinase